MLQIPHNECLSPEKKEEKKNPTNEQTVLHSPADKII